MTARWNGTRSWCCGEHRQRRVVGAGVLAGNSDDGQVSAEDRRRVDRHGAEIDERADLDQGSAIAQQGQRRAEAGGMTRGIDHHVDPAT